MVAKDNYWTALKKISLVPAQNQIYQEINLFPLYRREITQHEKSWKHIGFILLNEISYSNIPELCKPAYDNKTEMNYINAIDQPNIVNSTQHFYCVNFCSCRSST